MKKVLLILCDGMRPDAIEGLQTVKNLQSKSSYTFNAQTVFPSVTLPCHMSLFHSVKPDRHGITTNTYTPQVRPINGLAEVLKQADKRCALMYSWEQLKDITRPGSLCWAYFKRDNGDELEQVNEFTNIALKYINESSPDFMFLYFHITDLLGHGYGWMSQKYLEGAKHTWDCIDYISKVLSEDYTLIVTADHGGHDRIHGHDIPEDMTIPLFIKGENFPENKVIENASILDIAPTIVDILGVKKDSDWEGKSLYPNE